MRTSHNQRINVFFFQRRKIPGGNLVCYRIMKESFLHQRHKERTRFSNDLNIRAQLLHFSGINTAPDGRLGSNHANLSIMGCLGSRARARVDNSDDRDIQFLFDRLQCTRRGRVAGNHDRLDSLCFQKTDDLAGIAQHRLLRFASIWNARRISKVYDALLRHLTHDLTGYRQTADA